MICRKCKTAMPAGVQACPLCKEKRGGRTSQAMLAVLLLMAFAGGMYLFFSFTGRLNGDDNDLDQLFAEGTDVAEAPGAPYPPTGYIANDDDEDETPRDPMFVALQETARAASEHMRGGSFVSMQGFLFDAAAEHFVTADMLDLPEFDGELPMILYLMPADFMAYGQGALSGDTSRVLQVYAAVETAEMIAISDANYHYGHIFREDLGSILARYNNDHGPIRTPEDTDTFLRLATVYTYSPVGHDILWLLADDKYAFAAMSELDEDAALRGFVFEHTETGWIVALGNLQDPHTLRTTINRVLPDFNYSLLPLDFLN